LTQSGHERAAFAAVHDPDLLYLIRDPWAWRHGGVVARRRRSDGRRAMKKRGRETTRLRGRKAPTGARHRNLTAADLQKQLNQRTGELAKAQKHLAEALEQQTATAEVLRAISSSSGELEPVFQAMLANAVRICEASYGVLFRFENGAWRAAAMHEVPA